MSKKFCGLIIILAVFCGVFAASPAAYAMTKTLRPTSFGCEATAVTVQKNGDKLNIQWQYDPRLEGTQVKINLYRNGSFLRTITENVSIGKNGLGSWDWGNRNGSWDWGSVPGGTPGGDPKFQIEIVSLADSNLRVMGDKFAWDWGNKQLR